MLHPADMVLGEVCEYAYLEWQAVHPVLPEGDGAYLHHRVLAAHVRHPSKLAEDLAAYGRGVVKGLDSTVDIRADGAHDPGLMPGGFQNGPGHIGRGGLALGAGYAYDLDIVFCGLAEEGGAHQGQGLLGVGHKYRLGVPGIHGLLGDDDSRAGLRGLSGEFVPVRGRALKAHEGAAAFGLSGVVNYVRDIGILVPLFYAQRA